MEWGEQVFSFRSMSKPRGYQQFLLIALSATFLSVPATNGDNVMQQMDRQLEEWQLELLTRVKARPGVQQQPFTTDGCSGGLSEGWNSFSRFIPAFRQKFGDKPPWESCCVEHDRAYWNGDVDNGYQKRLEADMRLRQCVIEYGRIHSPQLAVKYNIEPKKVEKQFSYAGELMYQAVRVGGKPCSLLPWRWGYGWPQCDVLPIPDKDQDE